MANDVLLSKIEIAAENIHRIKGENQAEEEVIRYTREIEENLNYRGDTPVFDLIILGMGPDGHIGSLLPNSYALFDTQDLVSVVYQIGKLNRITLTHPVLCAAANLLVMISGVEKAEIVKAICQTMLSAELKSHFHNLDDLEKAAVQEAAFASGGELNLTKFKAKYGQTAPLGKSHGWRAKGHLVDLFIVDRIIPPGVTGMTPGQTSCG